MRQHGQARWKISRPFLAGLGCLLVVFLAPTMCQAQCVERSQRLPDLVLDAFVMDPTSVLRELRFDKEKLTGRITGYIVTDIKLLAQVRDLVSQSTKAERTAIGAALFQAQLTCLATKTAAAQKIDNFVRKLGDSSVLAGYTADSEDNNAVQITSPTVGEAAIAAPPPPLKSKPDDLMTGEWKTDVQNPFESPPVPQ
jgi:hypothetical protein